MKSKSILGKLFALRIYTTAVASVLALPLAAQVPAVLQVPTSSRVAGNTVPGWNQDFGPAITTDLNNPTYTTFDSAGNQYIADTGNNCVRKVNAATGNMSVLVGYEANASSADTCNASGLTPTPTQGLLTPRGLAVDPAGDLFIADGGHNCIRELPANAAGARSLITVVDTCSNYGSPGSAFASVAPNPQSLVLDPQGDEIWSSFDPVSNLNQVIFHKQALPADPPTSVCDVAGTPLPGHNTVCTFYNGQNLAFNSPTGLVLDAAGTYYLSDTGNNCVRQLTVPHVETTIAGQCANDGSGPGPIANFSPLGLALDNAGNLYIANQQQATVLQYQGNAANIVTIAGIPNAQSNPYTGAQEGIPAVSISLNNPTGLASDAAGNIYVADTNNGIVRQLAFNNQFPSTPLHNASNPQTLQFEINNPVTLTATPGADFQVFGGNNTCAGALKPSVVTPSTPPTTCRVSLAFDPSYPGERRSPLTLTDSSATPAKLYDFGLSGVGIGANALFIPGTIHTVLPSLVHPTAVVVGTTGNVYVAESGSGQGDIQMIPAGGSTATPFVPAGGQIQAPVALALDAAQNLYVADSATNTIYKVDANANVSIFKSGLNSPVALAVDNYGNVYVAQNGTGTLNVTKIFAGGEQLVVAGGGTNAAPDGVPATQAQFVNPSGLYLDANGVLYVSDAGAYRVYSIDTTGTIHFFAGNGTQTTTSPLVPTGVGLQGPTGIVGDAGGDIYVTDGPANLIYVVFGGSNQNPGIEALVGTGTAGNSGDGGPANVAELSNPVSVGLDGPDDLFLIDAGNSSLREVNYQDPTLNFGNVKPGTTAGPLSTQLWDSGNEQLAPLTSFQPADMVDFALASNGCGGLLQVGSTCELSYTFTPPAYGAYETTASSNANAVDIPQVITLIGNSPQPTFTTPPVTVVYGTTYSLSASITNPSGTAPTGTISFAITGPDAQTLCGPAPVPANGTVLCSPSPTLLNVGGYPVVVSYSGDANYLAATSNTTLTITPAPVIITAANATRPYNTPNPAFTGTITGVVAGQSITDTYTTTATQTSAPGTYPITPGNPAVAGPGTLLTNYSFTFNNGTLTITQNSGGAIITSPAISTVYGTAYTLASAITSSQTPAPTGTATFSIGGQALCTAVPIAANGSVTCSPSPTLENAGSYSVTVAYSGDTYYPASTGTIALTITQAPVVITANNATRAYGTPNPAFTGQVTGVVGGQSITDTYSTSATLTSVPGNYPITPSNTPTAGTGTLLTNYSFTFNNGTLTITQATGGATLTTPAVSAVYGTPYTLAASITSSLTPAPTGTVTFTIGGQAICPTATLGTNGTVSCGPAATLENAGTYTVTVTYSGDTIYPASASSLVLTIAPAALTITANNATRPYNTPNPTLTGTVGAAVTGQSITATYTTTASTGSAVGTYPIVPVPAAGPNTLLSNYAITLVQGILTVTQVSTPPPTGPTGSFTLAATPPEQEIDKSGGVNFPVTLTSIKGFTDTVSFSCTGLPEGASCSFAPAAVTPVANGTSNTVMTINATADGTNVPSNSYGALRTIPASPRTPPSSIVFAWTMLPIGFSGSAASLLMGRRRRRRAGKSGAHPILWLVPFLVLVAGIVGCASPNNYKIYTVTITATDTTFATPVSQSTTVQLVLAK